MYNTRRNAAGTMNAPQKHSASAVGQRRPMANNFVAGGQLMPNTKPGIHPPQQQPPQMRPPQTFNAPPPLQQQQQQQQTQQRVQQQQQLQHQPPLQIQSQPNQHQDPKILFKTDQSSPQQTIEQSVESNGEENKRPRPAWMRTIRKVSRKERIRRRNKKLVKILQPKNAIMVLNEMVPNVTYTMIDSPDCAPQFATFKASVTVEGVDHLGIGKSKMAAKASAAEAAIKFLVFKRIKMAASAPPPEVVVPKMEVDGGGGGDGTESMDATSEAGDDEGILPWQHVASFALHKLFANWDDGGNFTERLFMAGSGTIGGGSSTSSIECALNISTPQPLEKKPAKKMPEHPEVMNPIMLLNQMMPNAVYDEVSRVGNPPHISFFYRCTAGTQAFYGSGSSKKAAKKMCAFEACRTVLMIQYPVEVYNPEENPQAPPQPDVQPQQLQ